MTLRVARPDAANLVLRTYGRALHPDLLCSHKSTRLTGPDVTLDVCLIAAGHALILRTATQTVTEVISDRREANPVRGRVLEQRFKGCHTETIHFETGLRYDVCSTLERLSLAVFLRQHEEMAADGLKAPLFAELPGKNRFSPGPLSVIQSEVCRHSAVVHACHTFPEQLAVVKTQTLVEWD